MRCASARDRGRRRCCDSPAFSVAFRSVRAPCHAGAKPNVIPVSNEINRVKASTRPSIATLSMRGTFGGRIDMDVCRLAHASISPAAQPIPVSTRLSVKNCRINRPRLAPSAARMAVSALRRVARAKSRLATFEHAISKTSATAPSSSHRVDWTSPKTASVSDSTLPPRPAFVSGNSFSSRCMMASIWVWAVVRVAPGLSRANTSKKFAARDAPASTSVSGSQSSRAAFLVRPADPAASNDGGITPMIVSRRPSRVSAWPMAEGSPANLRCQKP